MKKMIEAVSEMVETFAISLILFLAIYTFLAFPEIVVGGSMEPSLFQGERLLVERITPKLKNLKRGDVVIFNPPGKNHIDYVKRVIGMPGETLRLKDCKVHLVQDGRENALEETYLSPSVCTKGDDAPVVVPDGHYFVMGDNREHSADSRFFGPLKSDRIVGKVLIRFWPVTKLSFL